MQALGHLQYTYASLNMRSLFKSIGIAPVEGVKRGPTAYKAPHNKQISRAGNALRDLFPSALRVQEVAHKEHS